MSLTPDDVRAQRFSTVRLREGYQMLEVDLFLERVASSIADLQGQLAAAADPTARAAEVLALAQRTASEHVEQARTAADAVVASLQHQVEALNARIHELQQIETEYRSRLKDFISSHLDEL